MPSRFYRLKQKFRRWWRKYVLRKPPLTFYDLERGAIMLYPVLTPLRDSIPRKKKDG